jgi:hypothetical protein
MLTRNGNLVPSALILGLLGCGRGAHATAAASAGSGSSSTSSGLGGAGGSPSTSAGSAGTGHGGASPDGGPGLTGTPVNQLIGVNGFIDDPIDKLSPVGVVREYHNWGWIADNYASGPAYPGMLYTFMNFNGWDWDVFFSSLQAAGASGFPAVQGSVPWMNNSAIPPVLAGADPTAAASYVAHADAMFQIAARYGATKVPDAELKLQSTQTRLSGLGTVHYFEDFNEPDQAPSFAADADAAMASADYDGDQGRLGTTVGVKNADPTALMVMGGLSGHSDSTTTWVQSITTWLDGMRTWSAAHRAGSFPADVINVHYYSFGPSPFGAPDPEPALSPEADGVEAKLGAIIAYRDQYLPGKEVWWTEFGYDTYVQSNLHAPALGANSALIVQGQWLVRDMLAALAAGVNRATLYVLRDSCVTTDTACMPQIQFNTAGLTGVKGDWTPKPSWYFLATFRTRLGTMVFKEKQTSGNPNVNVYALADTASAGGALVVWAPSSTAAEIQGYSLALPAGAKAAKAVTLADQMQNGVEAALTPSGGSVTIDVTETPTIVLVDSIE